jgi:hypothetical protein
VPTHSRASIGVDLGAVVEGVPVLLERQIDGRWVLVRRARLNGDIATVLVQTGGPEIVRYRVRLSAPGSGAPRPVTFAVTPAAPRGVPPCLDPLQSEGIAAAVSRGTLSAIVCRPDDSTVVPWVLAEGRLSPLG